jgi:uncharacterized protein
MHRLSILLFCLSGLSFTQSGYNHVYDYERIFSNQEINSLNLLYDNHEAKTTNQFALITVSDIGKAKDIQHYATQMGKKLGVGQKDKNNGLLIVFSKTLRKSAIATGLGTEKVITDSIAQYVINQEMIPHFKKGNYFQGVYQGSEWLITFLERPENKIE